jgi:hypothetical protein
MIYLKKILLLVVWMLPFECLLTSCSDGALAGAATMNKAKVWLEKIKFKVNDDSRSFRVYLAVAYDAEPLGKLTSMTADQYIAGLDQLKKDYADKADFFQWEIVAGEKKEDEDIALTKAYGLGGFVFAQYDTPDAHRQAIADQHVIMIHLDKKDFYISKVE